MKGEPKSSGEKAPCRNCGSLLLYPKDVCDVMKYMNKRLPPLRKTIKINPLLGLHFHQQLF